MTAELCATSRSGSTRRRASTRARAASSSPTRNSSSAETQDGQIILIDEALTPDSSRFWPADQYEPGRSQPSFDKQFVRDYLETLDWDKQPPAPPLPPEIAAATTERYLEAYRLLAGIRVWSLKSGVNSLKDTSSLTPDPTLISQTFTDDLL